MTARSSIDPARFLHVLLSSPTRESPALPLAEKLLALGADLRFHEPCGPDGSVTVRGHPGTPAQGGSRPGGAMGGDVAVLLQAHRKYLAGPLEGVRVVRRPGRARRRGSRAAVRPGDRRTPAGVR